MSIAEDQIRATLTSYGLSGLIDEALAWFREGLTDDEIEVRLENNGTYRQRFAPIFERRDLGLTPMSPLELIEYERQAAQFESLYGLPTGFIDTHNFVVNDVSVNEMNQRLALAQNEYLGADTDVRDQFDQLFGGQGGGFGLAAFLDVDRAAPLLGQQLAASRLAARDGDFNLNASEALDLAQRDDGQTVNRLTLLNEGDALVKGIGQGETDLSRAEQLAIAGGDPEAIAKLAKRQERRVAASSSGGQAAATGEGIVGAG